MSKSEPPSRAGTMHPICPPSRAERMINRRSGTIRDAEAPACSWSETLGDW